MTAPLDSFETALLDRLRDHVVTEAGTTPAARRTGWSRPRVLAAAVGTVAAASAVVVVPAALPSLLGGSTAYSVQEGNAGEVVLRVQRLEDAAGLEAALAEHGIRADVTYLPDRGECAPGRYEEVARPLSGLATTMGEDRLEVTLPPGAVRDRETFVMAVSGQQRDEVFSGWTDFGVAAGPVGPCEVRPASD